MPGFGLGLTDLAKLAWGVDKHIAPRHYTPDRLLALARQHRPKALAFTSLNAARTALGDKRVGLGRVGTPPELEDMAVWALSSPSGANGHFTMAPWRELAEWRRGLR